MGEHVERGQVAVATAREAAAAAHSIVAQSARRFSSILIQEMHTHAITREAQSLLQDGRAQLIVEAPASV